MAQPKRGGVRRRKLAGHPSRTSSSPRVNAASTRYPREEVRKLLDRVATQFPYAPISSDEMRVAWHDSVDRKRFWRSVYWSTPPFAILVGAIYYFSVIDSIANPKDARLSLLFAIITGFYFPALIHFIRFRNIRRTHESRLKTERFKEKLNRAEAQAAASEKLDLSGLWIAAQGRLNYYHDIALSQSRTSFLSGQIATALGFLLLIIAIISAAISDSTSFTLVAGSVGATGAALGGFIGRTFLKTQEISVEQLRSYFVQPLEVSRHLAAERLVNTLEGEDRSDATRDVIRSILGNSSLDEPKRPEDSPQDDPSDEGPK